MTIMRGVMLSLLLAGAVHANPGDLDPTFGVGGIVTTAIGSVYRFDLSGHALVQQTDGKLVAAGGPVLARYNGDGTLDLTFGAGGIVNMPIGANALVEQADGKLVAAGTADREFALARYNADGSPDATFGTAGIVTTAIGIESYANALVQETDGKVVVAGVTALTPTDVDFVLVRYNADGSLDPSFGTGGIVTTAVGATGWGDFAQALVQQDDGKLVAAGSSHNPTNTYSEVALVRYDVDGTLDPTFGSGGIVRTAIGTGSAANALVQQADGKLVAVGGADNRFALVRYERDGSLDHAFGVGGIVTTWIGPNYFAGASALVQQLDGKLVAAGSADYGFALARYDADGSLDPTFGTGGIVTTPPPSGYFPNGYYALVQQADGKLAAAGDFALVRYKMDGTLDATFGAGGVVRTPIAGSVARALVQQADGKLVAAGRSCRDGWDTGCASNGTNANVALARYKADGSLDPTFGTGGIVTTAIGASATAAALVQQADGKLVAAGAADDGFAVARYQLDGSLDPSFGTGGIVTTPIGRANALVQQADGKLVAAGTGSASGSFTLARYNANGSLDPSFGAGGIVTTPGLGQSFATALVQQPDGKLVAAGGADNGFALVRYQPDGRLDPSFGTGGTVTTPNQYPFDAFAAALAQQTDGKLVAAGELGCHEFKTCNESTFALARYNEDGSLDATFGSGGFVATPISGGMDIANGLVQQADGKLVAGGTVNGAFALARYNADGSLDPTFGTGGIVTTTIGTIGETVIANAWVHQLDGKLVAAGVLYHAGVHSDFAVVRYQGDGPSITTTTVITTTTLPTGCDLQQLPEASLEGALCAITTLQHTLSGPPQPDCATHCHCSLQTPLGRVSNRLTAAQGATTAKQCKRKLASTRRAAHALSTRVSTLIRRRCLAPTDLATTLGQETRHLSNRLKALSKSPFCVGT